MSIRFSKSNGQMSIAEKCDIKYHPSRERRYRTMTEAAKAAQRAYSKKYYQEHKAQVTEYNRKWREGHRAELAAYYREWRAAHPERQKEYNRRYWERKGRELAAGEREN